jgi:hypothetical protein
MLTIQWQSVVSENFDENWITQKTGEFTFRLYSTNRKVKPFRPSQVDHWLELQGLVIKDFPLLDRHLQLPSTLRLDFFRHSGHALTIMKPGVILVLIRTSERAFVEESSAYNPGVSAK